MKASRARLYDALALLTAIVVIVLDQWTKALVVQYLSPPDSGHLVSLIGDYLTLDYVQNSGAAFSMFTNTPLLAILIVVAIAVIVYLYLRVLNTGSLALKLIFGMILGGAAGNLIDRIHHGGYVVDFVFFRIPQIGFQFAVFNLADASISVGVVLLFVYILFGSWRQTGEHTDEKTEDEHDVAVKQTTNGSGALRSTEQDV
ncbi:MAG TPA: signal peptidase II [Ktedonobacteraceae bacterium]|nr:signal peptidase II [Ktedonobacteraceae bacterium]